MAEKKKWSWVKSVLGIFSYFAQDLLDLWPIRRLPPALSGDSNLQWVAKDVNSKDLGPFEHLRDFSIILFIFTLFYK